MTANYIMLDDREKRLLSAYIDGELSPEESLGVEKLLRQSPAARSWLNKLQNDSIRLKKLPTKPAPEGVPLIVLDRIGTLRIRRINTPLAKQPVPLWAGFAVAAGVLMAAGLGSYVYFSNSQDEALTPAPRVARSHSGDSRNVVARDKGPKDKQDNPLARPDDAPAPKINGNSGAVVEKTPNPPAENKPAVDKSPTPDTRLAFPLPEMEMFEPKALNVSVGTILDIHQLDGAKLRAAVKAGQTMRLELPCRDTSKAFCKLETGLKSVGANVLVDQIALARLKLTKMKTNYVFYFEDVTVDDIVKLLGNLSAEDKRAESAKKGEGVFGKFLIEPMSEAHHKQLIQLLGIDPRAGVKNALPTGIDPKKPLSETTGNQVVQTLTGQGGPQRPDPSKPVAKPSERWALALAYNPVRAPANSIEVKRFLDSRKPGRPESMQILLVLRNTN